MDQNAIKFGWLRPMVVYIIEVVMAAAGEVLGKLFLIVRIIQLGLLQLLTPMLIYL
jgi:hypothetical protein